jgi:hypothetical protein
MGTVFRFELQNELRHEGETKNVTRMVQGLPGILGRMVDKISGGSRGQLPPRQGGLSKAQDTWAGVEMTRQ